MKNRPPLALFCLACWPLLAGCGGGTASAPDPPARAVGGPVGDPVDEVDALVRELRPPARFAEHAPEWSVGKETFTFHHAQGPRRTTFRVVRDGERCVAVVTPSGEIHVVAFRPEAAPRELPMPKGRYHFDTFIGSTLATGAFIGGSSGLGDDGFEWRTERGRLVLTRRWAGERKTDGGRGTERVDTTNTFVFRVDPVHGYMVEGTYDAAVAPKPAEHDYAMGYTPGSYSLWPGTARCQRMFFTPAARPGYDGWGSNLMAIDICDRQKDDYVTRDGGFVGYLDGESGWSVALTVSGGDTAMSTCNAHANFLLRTRWPAGLEPDGRGLHRHVVRHRLLALPPELTRHVWGMMRLRYTDMSAVMIRVGVLEDFEGQPYSMASNVRGIVSTGGLRLSASRARSGTKSLEIEGRVWPNLPQVALEPSSRYRLEAWTMSEDEGAELFMTGHLYEWSPHAKKWWREQKTNVVRGGSGWGRAALEFETPEWDPFIDIVFHCEGGRGWVDDFSLVKVEE